VTIRSTNWSGAKLVKDATEKKNFFDGIKILAKRWNRRVEVEGDYAEKEYQFRFHLQ
jgi:hypothetical protein